MKLGDSSPYTAAMLFFFVLVGAVTTGVIIGALFNNWRHGVPVFVKDITVDP